MNTHESFYLQKLGNSKKALTGKDAILIEVESCTPNILDFLTFRAHFDGAFAIHVLPEIPMADYQLEKSQTDNSTTATFLFPMSYLDSIWRNETFDRVTVKCGATDEQCELSLTYAAIVPDEEIRPLLIAQFENVETDDQEFQSPVIPAQPLFYWVCSIFPFFWCPPPAPPPMPPPQLPDPFPIDPEDPEYDYDDDEDYEDEDDYGDDEDDFTNSYLLKNGNYEVYAQPGKYKQRMKSVTVFRTYGLGSF